jgi:ribosomal protein S21
MLRAAKKLNHYMFNINFFVDLKQQQVYYENTKTKKEQLMKIFVKNNDIGRALRILKKKLHEEGETKELRERQHFVSDGERRRLAKRAGERRWIKKRQRIEQNLVRTEQNMIKQNRKKRQTEQRNKTVA